MTNNEITNHSKNKKSEVVSGVVIKKEKIKENLYGEFYDPTKIPKRVNASEKKIKDIKTKVDKVDSTVKDIERRINATTTFLMFVVGGVIIAFILTIIPLCFDYYCDSYDRYEKYARNFDKLNIRLELLEERNIE